MGSSFNRAAAYEMTANWRTWPPLESTAPAVPALPAYRAPDRPEIEALSEPQLLALLQMSRTVRAQAIWCELRQQYSAPPFTLTTFAELRDLGYADKPEASKVHRLSIKGFRAADLAADILQERHNIHAPYLLGAVRATTTLMCTCRWGCGLRRGDNMQRKALNAHSRHMATVKVMEQLRTALAPVSQNETSEG